MDDRFVCIHVWDWGCFIISVGMFICGYLISAWLNQPSPCDLEQQAAWKEVYDAQLTKDANDGQKETN